MCAAKSGLTFVDLLPPYEDSGSKCYEALKAPEKLEELELICQNERGFKACVEELLDLFHVPVQSESDGISFRDRLTIFQSKYQTTAFKDLPADSWEIVDVIARLKPGFLIDSGLSSIPSSTTTVTGLLQPKDSSTECVLLYSVFEAMVQYAVSRNLNGSEFEWEAGRILNDKADGYENALKLFTAHVWEKNKQDENDQIVSDRTPLSDQMATAAIQAFTSSVESLKIYASEQTKHFGERIFDFERPGA